MSTKRGAVVDGEQSEPADPPQVNHQTRRDTRLAPPSYDATRLPTPLVECGCGDCSSFADPLATTEVRQYAADVCPEPRAMTVHRATEVYLRYEQAALNSDDRTARYADGRQRYARLLDVDRQRQEAYDGLTTAMVTRRLSPISDGGEWLTPLTIDQRLHDDAVTRSMMNAIDYQLSDFDYEYVAVTAATDSAATPHEHILFWIDDPDDSITVDHFRSGLDKHTERVAGARPKDHPVHVDGRRGAITVRHDPPLADDVERDSISGILEASDVASDRSIPIHTAAIQYLASQLPHLVLGDVRDGTRDVDDARVDGAAIAWASPHHWIRSSSSIEI